MSDMVTYEKKHKTFVYRVAAVIVNHERVLLHRTESDHFWSLPGGQTGVNEPAIEALKREMREELADEVEVERLLWVVENFFHDQKQDKQFHELGLYFLAHLPLHSSHLIENGSSSGFEMENKSEFIFQWFPQDAAELRKIPIYPLFLKYGLANLPLETEHVINQDRSI
jgi:ADP-ribose pyrophosphatase YjhB (NUDIX family)